VYSPPGRQDSLVCQHHAMYAITCTGIFIEKIACALLHLPNDLRFMFVISFRPRNSDQLPGDEYTWESITYKNNLTIKFFKYN
jgi:hypothetical protein